MINSSDKKKWVVTHRYKKTSKEVGGLKGRYTEPTRSTRQQAAENNAG